MISASDVLHILSELHQYSLILIELKDATTLGILHSPDGKLSCFLFEGTLRAGERAKIVKEVSSGHATNLLKHLPVEQFLSTIEGKKAKHIWLEAGGKEPKELAFVSIAELKAHLRTHSKR
jgi:hypothetical protein